MRTILFSLLALVACNDPDLATTSAPAPTIVTPTLPNPDQIASTTLVRTLDGVSPPALPTMKRVKGRGFTIEIPYGWSPLPVASNVEFAAASGDHGLEIRRASNVDALALESVEQCRGWGHRVASRVKGVLTSYMRSISLPEIQICRVQIDASGRMFRAATFLEGKKIYMSLCRPTATDSDMCERILASWRTDPDVRPAVKR
ncbi:MAG: hypothetical protein ACKV2T_40130 [Kofleriaceae bacterium]